MRRAPSLPWGSLLLLIGALPLGCGRGGEAPRPAAPQVSPADAQQPPRAAPPVRRLPKGEGTRRMALRLAELNRTADPAKSPYLNSRKLAIIKRKMEQATGDWERNMLRTEAAKEMLATGAAREALEEVRKVLPAPGQAPPLGAPPAAETLAFMALCAYRIGVQENCVSHPTTETCLLPVRGKGVHGRQSGAREAIGYLTTLLESKPDDLRARWLLMVASMAVGEYPGKVPPRYRIPESAFASEYDVNPFDNAALRAGVGVLGHAGGAITEDFDGDGLLDIMISSMGPEDQLRLFHNNGDGTFADRTEAAGLKGELGGLNIVQADYDNDGHPDVFVLRGGWMRTGGRFPNSLLRNNGDGTFDDVTEEAGLLSFHPTQTGAWGDYDGDGFVDLMVGNESMPDDPNPSELYHNNGDGTFSDVSADLGNPDLGYVKGVVWGDYNNDGRQDLYVSVLGHDNYLYRNDGPRRGRGPGGEDWLFTDVAKEAGTLAPKDSFSTWFFDYDNDGWLDLYVGGYRITDVGEVAAMHLGLPNKGEMPRLYRNNHDGTFADVTHQVRLDRVALPMGSNFGDLDDDGWPDLYFGTGEPSFWSVIPNQMFRNDEGRSFQDVTTSARVGHLMKGHGVAFGDLDNDGDQDIFEEMGGWYEADIAQSVLYVNPGHGHHWITLRLEGRRSNRSAIGTRIRVRVSTPRGQRDIYATAGTGGSFGGNSLQQEIGLGDAVSIEAITITWPATGQAQVFHDVPLDGVYTVVEGEARPTPVQVKRFKL